MGRKWTSSRSRTAAWLEFNVWRKNVQSKHSVVKNGAKKRKAIFGLTAHHNVELEECIWEIGVFWLPESTLYDKIFTSCCLYCGPPSNKFSNVNLAFWLPRGSPGRRDKHFSCSEKGMLSIISEFTCRYTKKIVSPKIWFPYGWSLSMLRKA